MNKRRIKKSKVGRVISHAMNKTAVVESSRLVHHDQFKKYVKSSKIYKVHDEKNECKVGDRVIILEMRPLSKTKSWRVDKILERREALQ